MQRETSYDPVFDAQSHYRLLLDSMARPGKINELPRLRLSLPAGTVLTEAAALVGFALLNADVSFFVDGNGADLAAQYLLVNTSARPAEAEEADFVFATGAASGVLVEAMKKGTLSYPEEGATLVASVSALATEAQGLGPVTPGDPGDRLALTLKGPGVAGEKTFFVRGLSAGLLSALQQSNLEFPLGVDLVLADGDGHLAAIPRSSQIRWEIISTD
jgi:alpha-D-ribose 1-methylphosphonate 5-triphosphate synthase subunit PhnH